MTELAQQGLSGTAGVRADMTLEQMVPAAAAGLYHGAFMQEIRQLHAKSGGKALAAVQMAVEEMQNRGLLSADDGHEVTRICGRAFEASHDTKQVKAVASDVRLSFQRMLTSGGSPVALAIASVIADVTTRAAEADGDAGGQPGVMAMRSSNTVDGADVGGTVAGAAVGGILGSIGGAIAGAVLGGIAASGAALFTDGNGDAK